MRFLLCSKNSSLDVRRTWIQPTPTSSKVAPCYRMNNLATWKFSDQNSIFGTSRSISSRSCARVVSKPQQVIFTTSPRQASVAQGFPSKQLNFPAPGPGPARREPPPGPPPPPPAPGSGGERLSLDSKVSSPGRDQVRPSEWPIFGRTMIRLILSRFPDTVLQQHKPFACANIEESYFLNKQTENDDSIKNNI